ncbi:hypothetical protein TNCV_3140531 [Trichonephila clavipes]|nr:hypothetical protein TNCV_3140531 [Trichonephila clavipes]
MSMEWVSTKTLFSSRGSTKAPSSSRGSLNSKQPSSRKFSREVGGRPLNLPQGVLPQNWGGPELNRIVTCLVLKATANDRRTSSPCHDEFCGPHSDFIRQVALEKTKQQQRKTLAFSLEGGRG